jgi:hypothetical protein
MGHVFPRKHAGSTWTDHPIPSAVTEGNSGTKNMNFTLALSRAPPGQSVSMRVATANGSAVQPGDYTALALTTKTFRPGVASLVVSVPLKGDTGVEPNETVFVNVSVASANAVIADTQAVGTIINDDPSVGRAPPRSIYVTDVAMLEGPAGSTSSACRCRKTRPA